MKITMDQVTNEKAIQEIELAKSKAKMPGLMGASARGFLKAIGENRAMTEKWIAQGNSAYENTSGLYLRIFKMQDDGIL